MSKINFSFSCCNFYLIPLHIELLLVQNVIWLSEKILRKLQSSLPTDGADIESLLAFSRHVSTRLNVFRTAVENKHRVYENVYQFYLASQKVGCLIGAHLYAVNAPASCFSFCRVVSSLWASVSLTLNFIDKITCFALLSTVVN